MEENYLRKAWKRIRSFYREHFAVKMGIPLGILILVVAIVFQTYLKNQYYSFLHREVYRADEVFLSTQQSAVSDRIYTMVRLGSVFATDDSFYRSVGEVLQNNDDTLTLYVVITALADLAAYDNSISSMSIITDDGGVFQYNRRSWATSVRSNFQDVENGPQLQEIYGQLQDKVEGKLARTMEDCYVLSPVIEEKNGKNQYLLYMAFPIIGQQTNFSKAQGTMVVTYKMSILDEFLSRSDQSESEYTYGFVADESGKIIYHKDDSKIGRDAEEYLGEIKADALCAEVVQTGWKLYQIIDREALYAHVDEVYQKSIAVYLMVLILFIVFILAIYQYTLTPIKTISIALNTVSDGELNQKISVRGDDEICRLATQYNQMIDSLKEQKRRTEEAHLKNIESLKRANEAEREALESQINAHFLCNTLSAFNYNAIQAGNEELSVMLRSLSNILRYTFSASFQEVTVAQEIMWVEQYLYLQKYRLGDVFDYKIEYSEEYDAWPCCKLFIQPFVENSIIHGFKGREKGGYISVTCALDGERLKFVISDNGCGIPEEKAAKLQRMLKGDTAMDHQGIGIGVQNVTARLRMFYGSKFDIQLITRENEGTRFTLYLPIPDDMSDEDTDDWL